MNLGGLRRGARIGVFKESSGVPAQTSKSASAAVEGHAFQRLHDTWPESFSD